MIKNFEKAAVASILDNLFDKISDISLRDIARDFWEQLVEDIEKFDFAISNPPYQDEKNSAIFHNFQKVGDVVADKTSMVYPADKWMLRSGKGVGLDEFSIQQLNENTLKNITVFEDANSLFEGIELHGGISIVTKDKSFDNSGKIDVHTYDFDMVSNAQVFSAPGERTISTSNSMNVIVQKVIKNAGTDLFLDSVSCPTSLYGIGSNFIQNNKALAIPDETYNNEKGYVRVLANETTGTQGRVKWFWVPAAVVPKKPIVSDDYIIAISTRHAAGYGGRSQQARIFSPEEFFGDSRYGVASFTTQEEAENFFKWMSSDVVRILILSSSRRIKNFGTNVPLLKSYKQGDSEIDFSKDINLQLIKKYKLDSDDVEFMTNTISTLGAFAMDENSVI